MWRSLIYEARHSGTIRLESHRLGNTGGMNDRYGAMAAILVAASVWAPDSPARVRGL
ncbi:hypothetical protein [Streptacidiphilus sp. EB103A]|uniref:hypothetical protein n=1 Tax=Streptacidiphilus sp. EB103A TaxID=3156275 RepID=UPI0035193D53